MATACPDHNKVLTKHLKQIEVAKIQMRRSEATENVKIMEDTVDALITAMRKTDPLFDDIFQRKVYTGSFYDGLRVKSPTEFDLNMVLSLPFKEEDVEIIPPGTAPAFLQFKLKRSVPEILSRNNPKWGMQQRLEKFFDGGKCLLRPRVQEWIQSVIDRAIKSDYFVKPKGVHSISPSRSGPAFTYYILTTSREKIDVDLVPVIDGNYKTPKKIHKSPRFLSLSQDHQSFWFMVPKPYTSRASANPETYWRISFPEAEKQLLPKQGCVKLLIKLFKCLRDTQRWDRIASYYIKTLFLLELDKSPAKSVWNENELGNYYMAMLKNLENAIRSGQLTYYFHREANVLSGIAQSTLDNYAGRIASILKDITANPDHIAKYYENQ